MWLVSVDTDYYPYIKKYNTYEEALKEYEWQKKNNGEDDCVFLSDVKDYTKGENYDMEFNTQL